jgi:hypothetical protein
MRTLLGTSCWSVTRPNTLPGTSFGLYFIVTGTSLVPTHFCRLHMVKDGMGFPLVEIGWLHSITSGICWLLALDHFWDFLWGFLALFCSSL